MRKTKIVCTIGPASGSEEILRGLCLAGMNVARLNFSHNTHEDHFKRIELIKKVRAELELPIAISLIQKAPSSASKPLRAARSPSRTVPILPLRQTTLSVTSVSFL